MHSCAVSTCKNTSTSAGISIIFHTFPKNNLNALQWFMKCKRRDRHHPSKTDRICSAHFLPSDYENQSGCLSEGKNINLFLKLSATPTQNLPYNTIKPAEARRNLSPALARQMTRSSFQKYGSFKKKEGGSYSRSILVIPQSNFETSNETISETCSIAQRSPNTSNMKLTTDCRIILESLFQDDEGMDVSIFVQGRTLKAHGVVLRQASGYFRRVLTEGQDNCKVTIDHISHDDVEKILRFIYHGNLVIKFSDFSSLLSAAQLLQVEVLERTLQRRMLQTRKRRSDDVEALPLAPRRSKSKGRLAKKAGKERDESKMKCCNQLKDGVITALYSFY